MLYQIFTDLGAKAKVANALRKKGFKVWAGFFWLERTLFLDCEPQQLELAKSIVGIFDIFPSPIEKADLELWESLVLEVSKAKLQ